MSEVTRLMRQIELEYAAAKRGMQGFAITARHDFINARYNQVGAYREQLVKLVGEQEANAVVYRLHVTVFEGD